jgi:hypothetical protein
MKRTSFLFAALTAIALLSCSSDNSNPIAEDTNYPKAPALKKGIPIGEVQDLNLVHLGDEVQSSSNPGLPTPNATSSKTVSCGSMSSTIPYNPFPQYGWSSEAICNFTSLPAGSINYHYEISFGGYSNVVGALGITHLYIECGNRAAAFNWNGDLYTVGTNYFAGDPANVKCYLAFYGRCNGTGSGGAPCSISIDNITMTSRYQY